PILYATTREFLEVFSLPDLAALPPLKALGDAAAVLAERLQKILAAAGIASRRHAEALITAGRVAVNDVVVRELGTRADPAADRITVDGERVTSGAAPHDRAP